MKKEGYKEDTITRYSKVLRILKSRGADLTNPESIKDKIASQTWQDGAKQIAVNATLLFYAFHQTPIQLPTYKQAEKIVYVPPEADLDLLISGCKHRLATFMQALKETGARYGELVKAKREDISAENLTFAINYPEKKSNARAVKISTKLLLMLNQLPNNTKTLFDYKNKECVRKAFQRARTRIAKNIANENILKIHFHTFRHWRAVKELKKTNNIWAVARLLGHKSLNNTQKYLKTVTELSTEWICEYATTKEEAKKLLTDDFTYILTTPDGTMMFRKAK